MGKLSCTLFGFITFMVMFFSQTAQCQRPITLEENLIRFSHGEYPGLKMEIPEAGYAELADAWTKKLEKGTKSKLTVQNGEYTIFGARLSEIQEPPVNVYSIIRSGDSAVVMEVTFEISPKVYVSREQSEKEFSLANEFLHEFGKNMYINTAKLQLKEEDRKLKILEKDLAELQNSRMKLEKSIVEEESSITTNEDKISLLKQQAENLNSQIVQEKALLQSLKGEEIIKAKETQIRDLEKETKQCMKDIEALQKKIVESNSRIEQHKLDIESNLYGQKSKTIEIEAQKEIAVAAEMKLSTIQEF